MQTASPTKGSVHVQDLVATSVDLPTLTNLSLDSLNLTSIHGLEVLKALKHLDLSFNHFSDVSFLLDLRPLSELFLTYNKITSMSLFSSINLSMLKVLDLSYNKISSVAALKPAVSLRRLNLSNNHLSTISDPFLFSNHLKNLDLSQNLITVISQEVIDSLPDCLEELSLAGNQLSILPNLSDLINLTDLDLSSNGFSNISAELFILPKLVSLNLDSQQPHLSSFSPPFLPCLEELSLCNNNLSTLPLLPRTTPKLSILLLSGNPLTFSTISHCLLGLSFLFRLDITYTYLDDVVSVLPFLELLNNKSIEELREAEIVDFEVADLGYSEGEHCCVSDLDVSADSCVFFKKTEINEQENNDDCTVIGSNGAHSLQFTGLDSLRSDASDVRELSKNTIYNTNKIVTGKKVEETYTPLQQQIITQIQALAPMEQTRDLLQCFCEGLEARKLELAHALPLSDIPPPRPITSLSSRPVSAVSVISLSPSPVRRDSPFSPLLRSKSAMDSRREEDDDDDDFEVIDFNDSIDVSGQNDDSLGLDDLEKDLQLIIEEVNIDLATLSCTKPRVKSAPPHLSYGSSTPYQSPFEPSAVSSKPVTRAKSPIDVVIGSESPLRAVTADITRMRGTSPTHAAVRSCSSRKPPRSGVKSARGMSISALASDKGKDHSSLFSWNLK
ncbi:hypothetical protein RCL1_009101 [Eukaryota sp. TZLM3-RCL]